MNAARWIVVVLIASIPALGRAQDAAAETPPEFEAPFAFSVNHVDHDDIIVVLQGEEVFVDPADLRAAGIDLPPGEERMVAGRKLLRLSSISPPLRYELDERAIKLSIIAPPELLPHARIDLAGKPPELVYTKHTSAFLNYAPSLNDEGRLDLYEEMGLSIDGMLLFSSAYLSNERAPVRGLTQLVVDDRPKLMRLTLGDALVPANSLGSGGFVGGVTLTRSFDLDPYAVRTPGIGLRGSTPTPARIDVLVNGARVRSEELAPGTFELDNITIGGGSGTAGYVIRDVFGNEQYLSTPFYTSTDALRPGLDEYTYSVGLLRHGVAASSWNYDEPVAFAQHRRGVTRHLTLGGRAEATIERMSLGPSLTALTGLGQFDIDAGASYDHGEAFGVAAQLGYSYVSRLFGFNAYGRAFSDRYAMVQLDPADDRTTIEAGAQFSVPVGTRLTLSYRSVVGEARDSGVFAVFNASGAVRLTNELNWLTSAFRRVQALYGDSWEVTTSLSYAFARGYGAQAAARTGDDGESLRLSTTKSLPPGEGFGYRASALIAEQVSGDGQFQYQTLFGRYGARYLAVGGRSLLTVDAAGAIVVVPGAGVFPTLPVHGAFGLIRVPGVAGVRGYGNHQEFGRTDRNGNLVIPNLLPYYGNHFSIAPEDVPLEYEIKVREVVLAPPPRGVALAEFSVAVPHFFRGRVAVAEGATRIPPKYGQLRILQPGAEALSPLGDEGEFELTDVQFGTHPALIEWEGGTCTFEMTFEPTRETVIDLGDLVCTRAPATPAP